MAHIVVTQEAFLWDSPKVGMQAALVRNTTPDNNPAVHSITPPRASSRCGESKLGNMVQAQLLRCKAAPSTLLRTPQMTGPAIFYLHRSTGLSTAGLRQLLKEKGDTFLETSSCTALMMEGHQPTRSSRSPPSTAPTDTRGCRVCTSTEPAHIYGGSQLCSSRQCWHSLCSPSHTQPTKHKAQQP